MANEELTSLINGIDDNDNDDDKVSIQESIDYQVTCKELVDLMNKNDVFDAIRERFNDNFGLVKALKSSTTNGIISNSEELNTRKKMFGKNIIEQKPLKSIYKHIWEALSDKVLQILIFCALISLIISFAIKDLREECIEGFAILFAVAIVTIVTALNNWQKEKQFMQLHKKINNEHVVSVVRDGNVVKLSLSELLVGDVCLVNNGDIVPADGILLEGNDLKVDESSLTGESQMVSKSVKNPALLSGTRLMEGTGKYIITAVGVNSKSGSIMLLLGATKEQESSEKQLSKKDYNKQKKDNREKDKSILQNKLAKLTIMVGWVGICAAIVTVCVLILHFCIETYYEKKEHWSNNHLMSYLHFIILGVTIMIVAIPEGLPLAVTISLAYSVKKMLVDNNLVRHLNACETMGRATTICSDKTGTLTTNRMTVVECYIQGFYYKQIPKHEILKEEFLDLFCQCVSLNSNYESRIKPPNTSSTASSVALSFADDSFHEQIGNKTECALLGFVLKLGKTYEQYRNQIPENNFVHVYTFNSNRKSMSTVIEKPGGGLRLFSKGAAEILLAKCTQIINKDGNVKALCQADIDKLNQSVIEPMASNGLRIICIAYRDFAIGVNPDWKNEESVLSDLICMAIVGIEDPIRKEVPSAIKKCQKAGITVRMITGDNISTAQSIALKCGILEPNSTFLVIEGREFNSKIRDEKGQIQQKLIDDLWPRIRVMARSSPEDKYNLVKGMIDSKLNNFGEVVAVTGDGTNDAPALKIADVGFAMGIQGTEVAKEASDIILTDDNFQSIVKAVMWGRNVYDSISKFIQFQLTVNFTAIFVSIIGSTMLSVSPLSAIQLLWVNLIMDSFASLALATEDPTDALLERKPYGRTKPLISRSMFRFILGHGLYQLIVILVLIFYGHVLFEIPNGFKNKYPSQHLTILFNVFVMMQIFNEINARMVHGERNVFKNILSSKLFIFIVVGTFIAQIFIVQFGGQAFSASPLSLNQWVCCIFIGVCELLWGQIIVTIPTAIKFKERKKIIFHK
ncbi:plasma membrane calcium-transporting ATPase 3 [Hydra vulgaris]|uniref:Calcium-transporting ATPase n=1 Tax=Hydra vulgaris TaxID=6087 RepID=A0ABM4D8I5_HYDVU